MYDLIVVGGGPAGSSAARRASLRGLKTLLLEKERFPRFKACAGAVSQRALGYLDFPLPTMIREKEISGLRLCYCGRAIESTADSAIAVTVTRARFDHFLLGKALDAGAEILEGAKAEGFDVQEQGVSVHTSGGTFQASFVVLAEGAQGSLAKKLGLKGFRQKEALSMVAQVEASDSVIDEELPGLLEMHIDRFRMGYCWVFPHEGYFSVGLWGFTSYLSDPKRTMREFLRNRRFPEAIPFRGHLIPAGEARFLPVPSRVIAAGDSAGFVDPLTGEGISYAIRSGQIAADCVAEGLRSRTGALAARYEEVCRLEFADNFKHARTMTETTYRFPSFFYNLLAADPDLYRMLLAAPAMKRLYVDYLLWMAPRLHRSLFLYLRDRIISSRS